MADSRQLEVILQGKDNLSNTLKGAEGSMGSFSAAMDRSVDASKQFAAGMAVLGGALVAFGVASIKSANESESAQAKLVAIMKNVKGTTDNQITSLTKLAEAQMRLTTVDDEATKAGMAALGAMGMTAKTIRQLTPAMLDLGVKMDGVNVSSETMASVGKLLGKAMDGNFTALQRYGIILTETQQEVLKTGTEHEKAGVLAKALEGKIGGLAEAMKNTTEGAMASMNVAFGELKETIGTFLQPVVIELAHSIEQLMWRLKDLQIGTFTDLWQKHQDTIILVAGAVAGMLAPAFIVAAAGAVGLIVALAPLAAIGMGVAYVAPIIADAWNTNWHGMRDTVEEAERAVDSFTEKARLDVYLIAAAVKLAFFGAFYAAIDVVEWFWQKYGDAIEKGSAKLGAWRDTFRSIWDTVQSIAGTFFDWFVMAFHIVFDTAQAILWTWAQDFGRLWFDLRFAVTKFWVAHQEQIEGGLAAVSNFIAKAGEWFGRLWFNLRFAALEFWTDHGDQITAFGERIAKFASDTWKQLQDLWNNVKGPLGDLMKSLGALVGPFLDLAGTLAGMALTGFMDGITVAIAALNLVLPPVIKLFSLIIDWIKQGIVWIDKFLAPLGDAMAKVDHLRTYVDPNFVEGPKADLVSGFTPEQIKIGKEKGKVKMATGGIVPGFGDRDTVPAMLTPGEEVLTRSDPRNARNGGGGNVINMPVTVYGSDRTTAQQVGDMILQRLRPALTYAR